MNALADADKLRAITYRINGGFTNFEAREAELDRAKALLGDPGVAHGDREIVDRGDFSDEVRLLQRLLVDRGFLTGTVDGKFGHGTYRALVAFKSRVGLEPLGYADAATLEALRAFAGEAEGALESGAALPRIGAEEEPVRHGISLLPEAGPGV
jgi:peptidoglycan hydrolase-like protein with peptidoglycan-binding domain